MDVVVRTARLDDGLYMDNLQRKHPKELALLPFVALQAYIDRMLVSIATVNGEPAAYLLGNGPNARRATSGHISQACVQYDARFFHIGSQLVEHFIGRLGPLADHIYLWCARDLEANIFWQACGFVAKGWRFGKAQLGRVHILWQRSLKPAGLPTSFVLPTRTSGGLMRKEKIVYPIEEGQSWTDESIGRVSSGLVIATTVPESVTMLPSSIQSAASKLSKEQRSTSSSRRWRPKSRTPKHRTSAFDLSIPGGVSGRIMSGRIVVAS